MSLCHSWTKGLVMEYQLIFEGDEESEESTEAPERERAYNLPTTMHTSPEIRLRDLYLSNSVNTSSTDAINSGQGSLTSQNFISTVPTTNTMVGANIKLAIFNGNGLEDLETHWFLCEAVCIVRQIQDKNIKKAQMITTLRGRALDSYMKFSIVPVGVV